LGKFFVARDNELNREIALKEILSRYAHDPAGRQRFIQEAEITGRLEHPGIVPVYGLGQYADGRPFYAMKFIRGETLKRAIERFHGNGFSDTDAPDSSETPATAPSKASSANLSSHSLEFREMLGRFVDVCNTIGYAHTRATRGKRCSPDWRSTLLLAVNVVCMMGSAGLGDCCAAGLWPF
jgi:serine/threonine protein kinase